MPSIDLAFWQLNTLCVHVQVLFQVQQVGVGVKGLQDAAAACCGESTDLNKGAGSPRGLMREMWSWR